jgi:hypothetical protein
MLTHITLLDKLSNCRFHPMPSKHPLESLVCGLDAGMAADSTGVKS